MSDNKETKTGVTEQIHNFSSRKAWLEALQNAPNNSWIKQRSLGGAKKSTYLPIQQQQSLTDIFFDEFDVIENKIEVIINEVVCTVKCLGLPSYPNAEYRTFAGIASKPIQCNSGSPPFTFPKGKKPNALEYNAPAARTAAISNALTTIGNVFGRNLSRNVSDNYSLISKTKKKSKKTKKKSKKSKK